MIISKVMVRNINIPGENNDFNILNIDTSPRSDRKSVETKEECGENDIVKPGLSQIIAKIINSKRIYSYTSGWKTLKPRDC